MIKPLLDIYIHAPKRKNNKVIYFIKFCGILNKYMDIRQHFSLLFFFFFA
uniref:Uncharacterized protein n=1 Tax=Meloidogyne enterolobii TaxID=390850 RepID=A0A6V7XZS6_MELEN|nr:unnamed protein product [Meloidogyne enterolobii]